MPTRAMIRLYGLGPRAHDQASEPATPKPEFVRRRIRRGPGCLIAKRQLERASAAERDLR